MTPVADDRQAAGEAHGKAILIGEHAVVYGQPAIVAPLTTAEVHAQVRLGGRVNRLQCSLYHGPFEAVPQSLEGIAAVVRETLHHLALPFEGVNLSLASDIPAGYGLGSSAAVAVAIVRALYRVAQRELSQRELLDFVNVAETYAHGTPSGIDAWAASCSQPLWFVRGQDPTVLPISRSLFLMVASSAQPGDTRLAVQSVRQKLAAGDADHLVERLGELARTGKQQLLQGDYVHLGQILTAAHDTLSQLGVSTPQLDALVEAALRAGAWGAKLTGGGQGGSVIALACDSQTQQEIAEALRLAGARQVWSAVLKGGR